MKRTEIYRTMTFDDFFSMKPELEQENYVRVDEALRGKGESNKVKGVLPLKVFLSLKEYPSIESHVSKNQFKSRCQDGREKEGESKISPRSQIVKAPILPTFPLHISFLTHLSKSLQALLDITTSIKSSTGFTAVC